MAVDFFGQISFIVHFQFHNSNDIHDSQITVSNQNKITILDLVVGSNYEFVVSKVRTHGPRVRAVYRCSKSSMKTTSLSKHPCIGHGFKMYHCFSILASILFTSSASLAACSIGPPCGALNFQNVESSTSSEGHGSTGKLFLKDNSHYLGAYSTTDYSRSLHFPHRWNAFYLC